MFVRSFVRLFVCSSVRPFVCSSVRLFVCSFVRLPVCSAVRVFVYSRVRALVYSTVRLFVYSSVRLFVSSYFRRRQVVFSSYVLRACTFRSQSLRNFYRGCTREYLTIYQNLNDDKNRGNTYYKTLFRGRVSVPYTP